MKKTPELFDWMIPCGTYRLMLADNPMNYTLAQREAHLRHYESCEECRQWTDEGGAER